MRLLIDLRTGEPAIDLDGNLNEINIERTFYQYIDILLRTKITGEFMLPHWGLDLRGIFEATGNPMWESIIKYSVAASLSPDVEPLISSIESISLERVGRELTISTHLISKYGTSTRNLVTLNE